MRPPSAAQSRAVAVAPAPRGFPVVAYPESIARGTRCLLLTHISIITPGDVLDVEIFAPDRASDRRSGNNNKFRVQPADISALQPRPPRKGIKSLSIGNA